MGSRVEGSRIMVIIAGLVMGAILGMWIYVVVGMVLAYGPVWGVSATVPEEIRMAFLSDACRYGLIPGLIVGFIAGLGFPFLTPRGHMAKSIGCTSFLFITPLAWWSQWHNLSYMKAGLIVLAVVVTSAVFMIIIPLSGWVGAFIEPLFKERGMRAREEESHE
jgi:hypothetical protein